jgi:hypothetical protein
MKTDGPELIAERVTLARVWLEGFVVETEGMWQSKIVEEDTPQDRSCRDALAQLLGSGLIKLDPEPDGCQFDHRQEVA